MGARAWLKLLPLALTFVATSGLAQDPHGFYIGLSAGQSKIDFGDEPRVSGATISTVSGDDTDTGFKIYGGYQFHRNFAVEGGWVDLGSFRATRHVTVPVVGSLTAEIESSGPYLEAVGILPLRQFTLFATAGVMYAKTEARFSTLGPVLLAPGVSRQNEDSEAEFKFGLGASFSFTKTLAVRAEYERFFDVGTEKTGEGDIDLVSVGIVFRF
jgi:OmpA-OmpF porin, OOP family